MARTHRTPENKRRPWYRTEGTSERRAHYRAHRKAANRITRDAARDPDAADRIERYSRTSGWLSH